MQFPPDFATRVKLATESFHQALAEYRALHGDAEIEFHTLPREEASRILQRAHYLLDGARQIVIQAAELRARQHG